MSELLPLSDVVRDLREEIANGIQAAASSSLRFTVGPIELEFTTVAKREGGTNAKVKFEVLGIGAGIGGDVRLGSELTQKIKMTLTPRVHVGTTTTDAEISNTDIEA